MAKTKTIVRATDAQAQALANLADAQEQQVVAEHAGVNNLAVFGAMLANTNMALGQIMQTAANQIQPPQQG